MRSKLKGVLLVLVIVMQSCSNRRAQSVLDDVGSFIQEKPDSALVILESLNKTELKTRRLRAKYSLLYSIALDKNYVDTTDLSIIQPASDFYGKHGTPVEKMKTHYYRGCIHANRGEDDSAMHYYLLALEDSSKVDDNHYKELVNSAISDLFSRNNNAEQELSYTEEALKYGKIAGDSVGVWAITGHLASCYANNRRWEDAEKTYSNFFSMTVHDSLTADLRRLVYAKDLLRFPKPDPRRSVEIIEQIAHSRPASMTMEGYCIYAYANQKLGNTAVANAVIEQLNSMNRQQDIVRLWRYRICRDQGQYKQALQDLEECVLAQDSIVLSSLSQSLLKSQRDFLQAETAVLKSKRELNNLRMASLTLFSILIVGILLLLHLRKKAALNTRIEELAALYLESQQVLDLQNVRTAGLNAKLAEKDKDLLQLKKQFATLYKAQYKALNDLCAAYLSPIKKDRKEVVYDEAMRQLEVIINDKETQNKFMSMVNNSLDNIIDKLRRDLPGHKELDFRFLMYVIVGFDATTISNLTGYSIGTVYTKKNRLKGEISSLSSEYRDFYLEYII